MRNPHWESPKERQRRDWEAEIADAIQRADDDRKAIENKRILEG